LLPRLLPDLPTSSRRPLRRISQPAPRIVALKTAAEAQALLRKEINAALSAIATTPAI